MNDEEKPNQSFGWPQAVTAIAILTAIVIICGVCTWAVTIYWRYT